MKRQNKSVSRLLALALTCMAGGCAVKSPPDHQALLADALPHAAIPERWGTTASEAASTLSWPPGFGDPKLEALIREALLYNADLRQAAARVEQAEALAVEAGAQLQPQLTAAGRKGVKLSEGDGLMGAFLTARWELDLWGRIRAEQNAAKAQLAATQDDQAFARLSIAAAVAKTWFIASEARQQLDLAGQSTRASAQMVELMRERNHVGASSDTDVIQAEVRLDERKDAERNLEQSRAQAVRALEILLGRYPNAALESPERFTAIPPDVPAGLPSELLERRPDIVAAEQRVIAAFYQVEEARAARLPRISLTAGVNVISSDLLFLKNRDNPMGSAGAGITAPIFSGGALQGQLDVSKAEQKAAVAAYAQSALNAFGEVENALSQDIALRERDAVLSDAVNAKKHQLALATKRKQIGPGDLRDVVNAELSLIASQSDLLHVESAARVQRVNLYLALGGGFEGRTVVPTGSNQESEPVR